MRLYLSVDLVGSTAFKARFDKPDGQTSPNPRWVDQIKHFYREFPEYLSAHFQRLQNPTAAVDGEFCCPSVWKTIGDEIVFCCRLRSLDHLACCLSAFLLTLREYGEYLDQQEMRLDVKAYGWVAAFPAPNVTVEVHGRSDPKIREFDIPDETVEEAADARPGDFDFLGKAIDAGFRAGKFCSADSLMLSIELAYLASMAGKQGFLDQVNFQYGGRESLKGVINDRPYPLIFVDAERNRFRKDLRERERALTGSASAPSALKVFDFISDFMTDEKIEKPIIPLSYNSINGPVDLPKSYKNFADVWGRVSNEVSARREQEVQAEAPSAAEASGDIPPEVESALTATEREMSEKA